MGGNIRIVATVTLHGLHLSIGIFNALYNTHSVFNFVTKLWVCAEIIVESRSCLLAHEAFPREVPLLCRASFPGLETLSNGKYQLQDILFNKCIGTYLFHELTTNKAGHEVIDLYKANNCGITQDREGCRNLDLFRRRTEGNLHLRT